MIAILLFLAAVPDLSGMLLLTNGAANAHGCPVAMDLAFTNRHVAEAGSQWTWGVGDGEAAHGLVNVTTTQAFRDFATVVPVTAQRFPKWYPITDRAPKVGEKLWLVQYNWDNPKKAFEAEVSDIEVMRIFNGQVIFHPAGKSGSSGGCVLNERGEIVAINSAGHPLEDKSEVGIGVGLWGDWLSLRPDEVSE